ncbi:MAG: SDR family NAD(P)-dependent oxidoreductase [Paludibacteraceae bacterium]|nr:SDR family NAD(P)-dependent oxidoreductase [Paludibacteraceae bacterium]
MARNTSYALVTGAATGMGVEYASQLAARGYNLLLVDINPAVEQVACQVAECFGITAKTRLMDLGTLDAAEDLYNYCHQEDIPVEVLINNAGVYHDKDIVDDTVAFTRTILHLHVTTPAMLCRLFGKDMRRRGKGYILNVSSITKRIAVQRLGTYGSTKAFLSAFTRSLHIELKDYGVRVLAVHPGAVDTGLYSIPRWLTKAGLALGVIVTPRYLVQRALNALFAGRASVTVPWLWSKLLLLGVALIPTALLRLIRKTKLF